MEFSSPEETLAAMLVTAKWLPELVRRVEPVLVLRGRHGWELELHLRNAFEDFLLADREARPRRLDPRLFDEHYAEEKLADVVAGRLAIVKTISGSRTARDARRKIEKTARHFQWLRVWEHEA